MSVDQDTKTATEEENEDEENVNEENVEEEETVDLETALMVRNIIDTEGVFESPIDINISKTTEINAPLLQWFNNEVPAKKIKIINTGHTIILSAQWKQERPYITNGPLLGKYVFSQLHLHWGANAMEGSEHTIDGAHLPGEIHVVMFKSCYSTQEAALKEKDGIVVLVYMLKLQDGDNPDFQFLIDSLPEIYENNTAVRLEPIDIGFLVKEFVSDYFLYWGSINTSACIHYILWLITRIPLGISMDQIDSFRSLLDTENNLLLRNFRPVQERQNRTILLVNPSPSRISTLLPEFKGGFVFKAKKPIGELIESKETSIS